MMTETTSPAIGSKLPLFFTYRDTLFGNGFVVEVQATNGRVLCVHEDDAYWMYGVNPGGMAASGDTPDAAHRSFRRTFSKILFDIASQADSFRAFRHAVEEFFNETNPGYEHDWTEAVRAVRAHLAPPDTEDIPRLPAESPRAISVEMKRERDVRVEDNRKPQFRRAIAA